MNHKHPIRQECERTGTCAPAYDHVEALERELAEAKAREAQFESKRQLLLDGLRARGEELDSVRTYSMKLRRAAEGVGAWLLHRFGPNTPEGREGQALLNAALSENPAQAEKPTVGDCSACGKGQCNVEFDGKTVWLRCDACGSETADGVIMRINKALAERERPQTDAYAEGACPDGAPAGVPKGERPEEAVWRVMASLGPVTVENAAERFNAVMWWLIDMMASFPEQKADPRTWEHLLVYQPRKAPNHARELWTALANLSFHCDGVTCTVPPPREVYNEAFAVMDRYKALYGPDASIPATVTRCTLTGNPCGTDTVRAGLTCPDSRNGNRCVHQRGKNEPLRWSKDKPSIPGWYWLRRPIFKSPECVKVIYFDRGWNDDEEWAGPVFPPESHHAGSKGE